MTIIRKPYFYGAQLKRYYLQIMVNFCGYTVMTGNQRDGKKRMLDVPIINADMQKTVGYILQGGSENVMSYVPMMSFQRTGLRQKADYRHAQQHSEKYSYIERAKTADGELIANAPGRKRTVERYQPVPYDMDFEITLWGSNNDQLEQMLEQILSIYNPDMDIQLSNSPADWTFLTSLIFQGEPQFEKVVPTGTEVDPLYIARLPFQTIVWMGVPAKTYETKHIYEVIVPIKEIDSAVDSDEYDELSTVVIRADEEDILTFESFQ